MSTSSPLDGSPSPANPSRQFFPTLGGPLFALAVLFGMNLLNYVDRYSFYAVATQVKADLSLSNKAYGFLSSSFILVYTLVTPFVGPLGDRYSRRGLLAAGVGLWSLATLGTAFASTFGELFFWRALLGLGEATYGAIAPALLADLFSPKARGRVISLYFLALPLGGALGYGVGGWAAESLHWRDAFLIVGLPGLIAAGAGLLIHDPGRGASEGGAPERREDRPGWGDYFQLFKTPTFLFNTFGMAAVTFTTGAYAVYGADFYQSVRGMSAVDAGVIIGGMTAVAGFLGIAISMWLPDFLLKFTPRAYLLVAFWSVALAVPFGFLALVEPGRVPSLSLLFVAMVLMAMVLGPCNTVTADVVPPNRRATGYAVSIFLVHLFGDISSPNVIGWVSDWFGTAAVIGSPLGRIAEAIGAPVVGGTNLTAGMLSVVPVMVLGAILFLIGSRCLPRDRERARRPVRATVKEPIVMP